VYIYHFSCFLLFLSISQVKPCLCLVSHVIQFSRHIPGQTVFESHFPQFSLFLAIFQELFVSYLAIFQVKQCLFSFSTFFSLMAIFQFLACEFLIFFRFPGLLPQSIFQVLQCVCLIFLNFQFSRHIPGPTVCVSHFPRFLTFSPYSRS
jgi:hypothetical protein